jgi:cytochrome d ubiquinol oxidase subunit II
LGDLAVVTFTLHGAIYLSMRTTGEMMDAARNTARRLWLPVLVILLLFLIATYLSTDLIGRLGVNPGPIPIAGLVALLLAGYFIRRKRDGWAFTMTTITIATSILTLFMIMYPRVMISTIDPAYSLTIYNASSSSVHPANRRHVALIFVPIVLIYQAGPTGYSRSGSRKRNINLLK